VSLFGFEIPHMKVQPSRDIIAVQLPYPPRKIGSIMTPDVWRDLSQHGMQAGIIRAMGPLAFQYKDGVGLSKQSAEIGDWVIIKWGAGTMFQAQKGIVVSGGWRYLSSFNDVIGVVPANEMPDPATLCWDESDEAGPAVDQPGFNFDSRKEVAVNADGLGAPSIIRAR
jgi:hypothetical protein